MIVSRRTILVLLIAMVAIVGISLGIVVVVNSSPRLQNTVTRLANIPSAPTTNTVKQTNVPTSDANAQMTFVARVFAERFGTTNNQHPDTILTAVSYATPKLEQTIRTNVTSLMVQALPTTQMTTLTVAQSFQFSAVTTTTAHVVVGTTRTETVGSTATTYQQDLALDLQYSANAWKVSAAIWRPR